MAKMTSFEKFFVNSRLDYYWHSWFGLGPLLNKLPQAPYKSILEIGCGVGMTTELLAKKYPEASILGTDFDEDSVAIAKSKWHLRNVRFEQGDATRLPYPNEHFDAAFSILTLHHIEDFERAVAELARIVKKGGDIYIMDLPSASLNFIHLRKSIVPGLFKKGDLLRVGEKHGFAMRDLGGRYVFSLHGRKL